MRALRIEVYRDNSKYDCTNGGISSRYDSLLIECEDGYIDIDENNPPENLVVMKERVIGGRTYYRLEPYNTNGKWHMMGGNFAYTSDSRFPFDYPLPIHDRVEE